MKGLKPFSIKNWTLFFGMALVGGTGLWLLACTGGDPTVARRPVVDDPFANPTRLRPKRTDPRIQKSCRDDRGGTCEGDVDCEEICNDIFSGSDEDKCKRLSVDMVQEFQQIFERLDDGKDLKDIKDKPLHCLLDISETKFATEVGRMTSSEIRRLFDVLTSNNDLAEVLREEDDEGRILNRALRKLSSSDDEGHTFTAFQRTIVDSRKLIELIVERGNEPAWEWVIGRYVEKQCNDDNSPYCSSTQAGNDDALRMMVFFCKVYKASNAGSSDISDLLSFSLFDNQYGESIEELGNNKACGKDSSDFDPTRRCDRNSSRDFLYRATYCVDSNGDNPEDLDGECRDTFNGTNNTVCSYLLGTPEGILGE